MVAENIRPILTILWVTKTSGPYWECYGSETIRAILIILRVQKTSDPYWQCYGYRKQQTHTDNTIWTENIRYSPARRSQMGIWWGSQTHPAARNQLDGHCFHRERVWWRLHTCTAKWYRSWPGSAWDKLGTLFDTVRSTLQSQEFEYHYNTDQHCLCRSRWWRTSTWARTRPSTGPAGTTDKIILTIISLFETGIVKHRVAAPKGCKLHYGKTRQAIYI
jgi:hypothetical protein